MRDGACERGLGYPVGVRLVLCSLVLVACRPRAAEPAPATSPDIEQVLAEPLEPAAPVEPLPDLTRPDDARALERRREARRSMVRRHRRASPGMLGMPPEPPGDSPCKDYPPDRCHVEFVGWSFGLVVEVAPPGGATAEERRAAHLSRAALRRRVAEAELDIVACAHEAERREPCLRRSLGVGFTVHRASAVTPARTEGAPDPETIRCLTTEVGALDLPRLLDPEATRVEVFVGLRYRRASYSAVVAAGGDSWFGPVRTRHVDPPCREPDGASPE